MPPHQQKKRKLGRAAKRRLRAARIAHMHQQAAHAAGQTPSTQATQEFMHTGEDDPTFSRVKLFGGGTVNLRSNVDPNLGPYHIRVMLRLVDRKGPDGYASLEHPRDFYLDGMGRTGGSASFTGISPADAFEMVEGMIEDQYRNKSVTTGIEIVPDANRIDWANVDIQHGSSYGDTYPLDTYDAGDTVLHMGAPVVDQSIFKAKPAYATPASYMEVTDG
eukprot:1067064-Pleurochrysis_carterae.AAC.1